MQKTRRAYAIDRAAAPSSKPSARKGTGSRRRTTDEEAADWRDRYEAGESFARIAGSVQRSPHTVKSGVQRAQAAQERTAVRREAMKEAFRAHLNELLDLLGAIGREFEDVTVPVVGLRGRTRETGKPFGPFNIPDIDAEDIQVVLDIEGALNWGLLIEHLGRDAAMRAIGQVKKIAATLANCEIDLRKSLEAKLTEATGLGIHASDPGKAWISRAGVAEVLNASCQAAAGRDSRLRSMAANLRPQDKSIMYGSVLLVLGLDDPEGLLPSIVVVLKDVPGMVEYGRLRSVVSDYAAATGKAADEIGVLRSAHFVPGECRACRRLGM
ncbi:MAG: hypothetical protein HY678_12570 [Chloroflexi bacterium]|nr:hypothetical protein [Chloroflexota bacterium]